MFLNKLAADKGTRLHAFASEAISLGQKLPKSSKTLCAYVNDAIGYKMTPEQVLYFSDYCFGTADAISFNKNFLRIHDLKTGASAVSMDQLMIYAALFCLEYNYKPDEIGIELRIYQNDNVLVHNPDPKDISLIMDQIIIFDKEINKLLKGA